MHACKDVYTDNYTIILLYNYGWNLMQRYDTGILVNMQRYTIMMIMSGIATSWDVYMHGYRDTCRDICMKPINIIL